MKNIITFLAINILTLSCANTSLQPDTYQRDAAQRVSNVLYGEIVSLKEVKIEGDTSSGTIVGSIVGAAAGSGISDSRPESEIGAVIGGVIGATLGGNISKKIRAVDGVQLVIKTEEGRTISIVQEVGSYKFSIGDLVEVISTRGKTRVSPSGIK